MFVAPEYNFGPTPALLNALNYVFHEWHYKPAGFVSYGGVSGGLRGVQTTKLVLTTLGIMPIAAAVPIPFVTKFIEDGRFEPNEPIREGVKPMLDALAKWGEALKPMRG